MDNDNITVCAFNSCISNDCFRLVGEISRKAVSDSDLKLRERRNPPKLKIAVWHHNSKGPPTRSDYIDDSVVLTMIDQGYRLALHGHQHKAAVLPYSIYTYEECKMTVVSVGSLCADYDHLPRGSNRQYNVLEISEDYLSARLHIRECLSANVFSAGRLMAFGPNRYADLKWNEVRSEFIPFLKPEQQPMDKLKLSEETEKLIHDKQFDNAIELLDRNKHILPPYISKLLYEQLKINKEWGRLETLLLNPQDDEELALLCVAAIEQKHWDIAREALNAAKASGRFSGSLIKDLELLLETKKGIS